jgi:hypothetical protein
MGEGKRMDVEISAVPKLTILSPAVRLTRRIAGRLAFKEWERL